MLPMAAKPPQPQQSSVLFSYPSLPSVLAGFLPEGSLPLPTQDLCSNCSLCLKVLFPRSPGANFLTPLIRSYLFCSATLSLYLTYNCSPPPISSFNPQSCSSFFLFIVTFISPSNILCNLPILFFIVYLSYPKSKLCEKQMFILSTNVFQNPRTVPGTY